MYAKFDNAGNITALSLVPELGFKECDDEHPDLKHFLKSARKNAFNQSEKDLHYSDAELARVLEDVIDLLSQKGLIQFTELPAAAQQKLLNRKSMRQNVKTLHLFPDDNSQDIKL